MELIAGAGFWRRSATDSEANFRQHVSTAVLECQHALSANDMNRANEWRDTYFSKDGEFKTEPFISIYENGMMAIGLYYADTYALAGKYSLAYNILGRFHELHAGYQQRRHSNGMPFAPLSECRCLSVLVAARCKWKTGTDANAVRSPNHLADEYLDVSNRIATFVALQHNPSDRSSLLDLAKITGVAVARMLYRHNRRRCQEILDNFNRLHGEWLNMEAKPLPGMNLNVLPDWYWDWKIGTALIDKDLSPREFDAFNRKRKAAAKPWHPGVPRTSQLIEWDSQRPTNSPEKSVHTRSRPSSVLQSEGQQL